MANKKKYVVAGIGAIIVVALAISFTSYLGQFEQIEKQNETEFEDMSQIQTPILGSDSAPVTIIEIGDYQCEMCKHWFDHTRPKVIENYIDTGKANLVFMDMPFLGQHSYTASHATYCALDQNKYWDYHVMLYEHQEEVDSGWASNERLASFAFRLGLDVDDFAYCMDSKKYFNQVKLSYEKSVNIIGAKSTPTFLLVNTSGEQTLIRGAQPFSTFQNVIESLL